MKKILLALALTLSGAAYAQTTCNGDLACSSITADQVAGAIGNGGVATATNGSVTGTVTTNGGTSNTTGGNIVGGSLTLNTAVTADVATTQARATVEAARLTAEAIKDQKIRNTPSVSGSALTSSNDTCMGSTSGSVNAPGIGIGIGSTWVDTNCKMLKNSRELWNMGMRGASMAMMCSDKDVREAIELSAEEGGYLCPQTIAERKNQTMASAKLKTTEPTDPFIRARLGLKPLAK